MREGTLFQEGGEREKLLFVEGGERDRGELYNIESPRHLLLQLCSSIRAPLYLDYPRSFPFIKVLADFLLIFQLILRTIVLLYKSLLARKNKATFVFIGSQE